MSRRTGPTPRPGYTLVELLIVVAIIAVLAALTTAAVRKVQVVGKKTTAAHEVNGLATGCTSFKKEFGYYPPNGPFKVPAVVDNTDQSFVFLNRMFPRWQILVGATQVPAAAAPTGTPINPPITFRGVNVGGVTLDGNQCMLLFLGGPTQQGWDTTGPYAPAPNANTKKGPYFEFTEDRLTAVSNPVNTLPWFVDPWGSPYAFFASGGSGYPASQFPLPTPTGPGSWNGTAVTPFRSGGRWVNSDGVQVICAGPNGLFGPGSIATFTPSVTYQDWVPGQGSYAEVTPGVDDIANFNGGSALGTGNQ